MEKQFLVLFTYKGLIDISKQMTNYEEKTHTDKLCFYSIFIPVLCSSPAGLAKCLGKPKGAGNNNNCQLVARETHIYIPINWPWVQVAGVCIYKQD